MLSIQITATLTPEMGPLPKDTTYVPFSLWHTNTIPYTQTEDPLVSKDKFVHMNSGTS